MLQNLICYLKLVNEIPENHPWIIIKNENNSNYLDGSLIKAVVTNTYSTLITEYGQPNFNAISKVRESGFPVYAGDRDSYGWITGCIETNKGIIVFG